MIHRLRYLCDLTKPINREMHAVIHHREDSFEFQEVLMLCGSQWICIEEGDDHFSKIRPSVHVIDEQIFLVIVVSAISIDAAAPKEDLEQLEGGNTSLSLHHRKPWLNLPSTAHSFVPLNRTTKTAFPIDEADDPLLNSWPFLLIVRTERIVTAHVITLRRGCDTNEYRRILGVSSI